MKPIHTFKGIAGVVAVCLCASQLLAASGSDSSSNYSSWTTGSTAGTGFGPWTFHSDNHGGAVAYSGLERTTSSGAVNVQAADNSVWKLYAIGFSDSANWEEATAYRAFLSPLKEAGDQFSLSFEVQGGNNGVGNPGRIGFSLRNENVTGSGNYNAGARLSVYLDGSTNFLVVEDALGQRVSSVTNSGPGAAYDFEVTLTGASTYSLSITRYNGPGATDAPVTITGTLAGSGNINSFSMFSWNTTTSQGFNSDVFFNRLSYSNQSPDVCPSISLRSLQNLAEGEAYSQSVVAVGGVVPYTYALTDGSLPAGMSLSSAGILSGTPQISGNSTFTVRATDSYGCVGSRTYTLGVYATGADNTLNYSSWDNLSNGGSGFAPWGFFFDNHGSGFAGLELSAAGGVNIQDAAGKVWKLYAVWGDGWEEAAAYRKFLVPLGQTGDGMSLRFGLQNGNQGIGNPGRVGLALRNGNFTGSSAHDGRARLQVYLDGSSSFVSVEDASGQRATTVPNGGPGSVYDCAVSLTGPDTYSLTITPYAGPGTNGLPATLTGTLAGGGPLDSLAIFNWNYSDGGANPDAYFNNLAYTGTSPVITSYVTFQVDMSAQILAGNFNPSVDAVQVRGTFNDWGALLDLTNNPSAANPNIYSGVVQITGAVGSGEAYKFVYVTIFGDVVYENSQPRLSTLDTGYPDYNRFLQLSGTASIVLTPVFFSDLKPNDFLQRDVAVTFSVDMNGATTSEGHAFDAGFDTVWINGEFIPWYAWYDPVNPNFGPSQYMLTSTGNGIYSLTVTIPAGKPIAFAYKYGIAIGSFGDVGPRDNEAGFGQDHFRVIRTTATGGGYTMPLDKFGVPHREPVFPASREGGLLSLGDVSGGNIPVSWLGRPGVHLQSAASLSGPWADHPNTDGAAWTAGVASSNGLMSITNWPAAAGTTFFRLVKP